MVRLHIIMKDDFAKAFKEFSRLYSDRCWSFVTYIKNIVAKTKQIV